MTRRARVLVVTLVIVALLAIAQFAFRSAGRLLVRTDPLAKSDAILILGSQRIERTLEAGELYREGWAPRVVVLRVRDLGRRGVLSQLNITLPLFFDNQVSALRQMGVPMSAIVEVRETIESTEGEARQIRGYASAHHFHRVIVVTSTYHTRRASRYLLCLAPDVQTIVRATRYEGAEPHDWWQWPVDRIDVLAEYMKWPKALMATFRCGR